MKCPVCKTECGGCSTCPECGFNEVGKLFINQDDASQWLNSVVAPFRSAYEKRSILQPLNWVEIFKQESHAKALFEITIPAAKKKQAALEYIASGDPRLTYELAEKQRKASTDAALGHIALKSTNELVDRHFIDEVGKVMEQAEPVRTVTLNGLLKPGDLAAVLTNLKDNSLVVFETTGNMKKEVHEILSQALESFTLPVTIGKGPLARSIQVDVPAFTAIFIVKKIDDIPSDFIGSISSIIELTFTKEDLLEYQIRETAARNEVLLTKASLEVLKEQLCTGSVKSSLKFIADYLFLHPEVTQPISRNEIRNILKSIC